MPLLQTDAIQIMTNAFRLMEKAIEKPIKVTYQNSFVYRYKNKGVHEALLQKLARSISGLNAIRLLLGDGFTQETGVLLRTIDEIHEDIAFLATSVTNNAHTERHTKYLEAFYADSIFSRQPNALEILKPNLVPRKKIRAHTMNTLGEGINISEALIASESISTTYSSYVHAASENIMDMYGGNPPHFHLNGMPGTTRTESYELTTENYIYRGLMMTIFVAKAFGDTVLIDSLTLFLEKYEAANEHLNSK